VFKINTKRLQVSEKVHLSTLTFATLAEQVNQPSTEVGLSGTNSLHFRYVCVDELSLLRYTSGHEHDRFDKSISVSFGWRPPINDRGLIEGCSIFVFSCKDDFLTVRKNFGI
jgi:hypothetical protein